MLKVAITGNIASGKTSIENILLKKNFPVLDTDNVTHDLLKNESIKKEIEQKFAGYDIFEKSEVSRQKLGQIVFNNQKLREKLEGILHPKIKEEVGRFFSQKEKQGEKIAFVSVPLLFEAKFEKIFDKIILIHSDDKIRLKRLMDRGNLSVDDAQKRMSSQISQDDKVSLSDYVIYNNKSIEDLEKNVSETLKLFVEF